ncbi:MAG: hypothetical protein H6536_04820 [Bacteroidales bacterium]|nr:hypothetical protein [Bacteroidales bacterium]
METNISQFNGKRIHKKQSWVHSIMQMNDYNLSQCLFGEHLLALNENQNKPIGIVESEKTAIIASNYINNAVWHATGGLELLNPATNPNRFKSLVGRKVILYPDLSTPNNFNGNTPYDIWSIKAEFLRSMGIDVKVSDNLERIANEKDRINGFDIADYISKEVLNLSSI